MTAACPKCKAIYRLLASAHPATGAGDAEDAARYRWLRSDDIEVPSGQHEINVYRERLPFCEDQTDELLVEQELDEAIDAAMSKDNDRG